GCSTLSSTAHSHGNSGRESPVLALEWNDDLPRHTRQNRVCRPSVDRGRMNSQWRRRPHATGTAIERSGGSEARPGAGPVRPAHGGQRHGELRHASGPEKGRRCAEEHYLAAWFVRAPLAGRTLDLETEALSAKRHDIRAFAARL